MSNMFTGPRATNEAVKVPHRIHRVTNVAAVGHYTLRVGFADGSSQTINFEPLLRGELYGPLQDVALFNRVQIDPEVHTLVWPNGADFDPATLHDWPEQGPMLIGKAKRWEAETATAIRDLP